MKCSTLPCDLRIGIIGAGQLGLMLFQQGIRLGFKFNVLGKPEDPLCKYTACYGEDEYEQFVDDSDIVTFEFEHANGKAMEYAQSKGKLKPEINSVNLKREREKEFLYLKSIGAPLPKFEIARDGSEAIEIAKNQFNNNAVIKRSVGGYDGKGQYFVKNNIENFNFLKEDKSRFVVVEYVDFDYEASIIVSRGDDRTIYYPPSFNLNKKGILVINYGPLVIPEAKDIGYLITKSLNYIGTMGIELFVRGREVLVNEISPRVHNSGHYTLTSCKHSQFESHLRAISGLGLLEPECNGYFGMLNLLGVQTINSELDKYGQVFMYNKPGTNPRRKVGHINVTGDSMESVKFKINNLINEVYGSLDDLIAKL